MGLHSFTPWTRFTGLLSVSGSVLLQRKMHNLWSWSSKSEEIMKKQIVCVTSIYQQGKIKEGKGLSVMGYWMKPRKNQRCEGDRLFIQCFPPSISWELKNSFIFSLSSRLGVLPWFPWFDKCGPMYWLSGSSLCLALEHTSHSIASDNLSKFLGKRCQE